MANHLGDTHVRYVFGADDSCLPGRLHHGPAQAVEGRGWQKASERVNELRAVAIARGLACREKKARIGGGGDDSSLARRRCLAVVGLLQSRLTAA